MARTLKISTRMILAVLLIHAVLLPLLSYGLIYVIRTDHQDVFVDHIRAYSRAFADIMEEDVGNASDAELYAHLDSMLLGGRCVFSALEISDRLLLSSMLGADDAAAFREDFEFGENGDNTYFLSVPLQMADDLAMLKLGFDESLTLAQIDQARRAILAILAVYLLVAVLFMAVLSGVLSRPLQRLRADSRKIASGDYSLNLSVDSRIEEIADLTSDLEAMRSELVGINARLRKEMAEREAVEEERREIESRLQHLQRLESIGTLAGGVAHEFNNILLPMLLYTDLALEDLPGDSPVRSNLERVVSLANRAKGLSQKILTFGRAASDSNKLAVELGPVVIEAMSMVRALIPANVDIRMQIEDSAGIVRCDPAEVQQLVVNLCSNAFLALPASGGHITVSLEKTTVDEGLAKQHPRLKAGPYVLLQVIDTGKGMDSATVARVFEPFFTTREVGKGTGLGLSVVHGIVVKHGGEIIVESSPGKGTTFGVYFPLYAKTLTLEGE